MAPNDVPIRNKTSKPADAAKSSAENASKTSRRTQKAPKGHDRRQSKPSNTSNAAAPNAPKRAPKANGPHDAKRKADESFAAEESKRVKAFVDPKAREEIVAMYKEAGKEIPAFLRDDDDGDKEMVDAEVAAPVKYSESQEARRAEISGAVRGLLDEKKVVTEQIGAAEAVVKNLEKQLEDANKHLNGKRGERKALNLRITALTQEKASMVPAA